VPAVSLCRSCGGHRLPSHRFRHGSHLGNSEAVNACLSHLGGGSAAQIVMVKDALILFS